MGITGSGVLPEINRRLLIFQEIGRKKGLGWP
jgi:hypothetical protein